MTSTYSELSKLAKAKPTVG